MGLAGILTPFIFVAPSSEQGCYGVCSAEAWGRTSGTGHQFLLTSAERADKSVHVALQDMGGF
jgi:hypothetical protein